MLNEFFKKLSTRLTSENNLSDLTWALAETNPTFLETFMELFKFEKFKPGEPAEIRREFPVGDSRPDFLVEQGDMRFWIENKIEDRQNHFEQYTKAFPDDAKGFISAYTLDVEEKEQAQKNGFRYSTWRGMVDLLQDKLSQGIFADKSGIVDAYVEFVKEVCGIMELKKVRPEDGVRSLHAFTRLASWVIAEGLDKEGFTCTKYDPKRAFGECRAGQYGALTYSKSAQDFYPLLGMEFNIDKDRPAIIVWVEEDWNKDIYEKFTELKYSNNSFDYRKDKDNGFLEFSLKDDAFDAFMKAPLESQKKLLVDFFDSVIDEIVSHI
jgi:hypothetical protein